MSVFLQLGLNYLNLFQRYFISDVLHCRRIDAIIFEILNIFKIPLCGSNVILLFSKSVVVVVGVQSAGNAVGICTDTLCDRKHSNAGSAFHYAVTSSGRSCAPRAPHSPPIPTVCRHNGSSNSTHT